jgi:hypothetical protein
LRCSRCGNENPETNRFCGMCGATMLQPPAGAPDRPRAASTSTSVGQPGSQAAATSAATEPQNPPPRADANSQEVAPISGPSFLGLNDPPPKPAPTPARSKANLSIDPGLPGSRSLDYLLDDEEESKGGAGKYFVIVLAVLLLLAFGYMRWKSEGFPWLTSNAKPSAAAPASNSDSGDSSSGASSNPPGAASPAATPAPSNAAPANSSSANSGPANSGTNPPGNNAPAGPASTGGAGSSPAGNSAATPASPAPAQSAPAQPNPSSATSQPGGSEPGTTNPAPATKNDSGNDNDKDSDENATAADTPAPAEKPAPPPKPRPAVPKDQIAEARKFLYGLGGTPQSCDRGMRLLKPLADQANAKAMIEMGALYSAGLCTPRDLPTAYRWFALALRKDPDNEPLQSDLQKLWGEMTQPERQLAIRLSQ